MTNFSSVVTATTLGVCLISNTAFAAIMTSGDVNPAGTVPGDFVVDTSISSVTVGGDFSSAGNGSIIIDSGSMLTVPGPSPFANVAPLSGSTGTVTVTGNDGFGNASTWRLEGTDTSGEGAFLTIGRGGNGTLNIDSGGRVEIDGLGGDFERGNVSFPFPAGFQVGREVGSIGVVNISGTDSELAVVSELAFGRIGRDGQGTMNITDGGLLSFSGINSDLNVASDSGSGTGVLNVNTGGRVDGPVFIDVGGSPGANGTINLDGSTSSITLSGACTPDCPDGYSFPNQGAFITVGANEGTGILNVTNGATFTIDSTLTPGAEFAGFNAGGSSILGPMGDGTINVDGSGSNLLVKGDRGFFSVGRLENGTGALNISGGGQVVMENGDGRSTGFVGDRDGASGTIMIDGPTSLLDAGNFLGIGVDFGGEDVTGNGLVQLSDGGVLKADNIVVGSGGTIAGNGIVMSSTGGGQTRVNRGTIGPGLSTGELIFDGDLIVELGTILLEADSPTDFDSIVVTGDLILAGGAIDVLLGFVPDSDFLFDPFNVFGNVVIESAFEGLNVFAADGSGIGSGVQLALKVGDDVLEATSVPEPKPWALLLIGFLVWVVSKPGLWTFRPMQLRQRCSVVSL